VKIMSETKPRTERERQALEAGGEEVEGMPFDPTDLADAVGKAREGLRTAHPSCFERQPEQCEAVREADAELERVEQSLRGRTAGAEPDLGGGDDDAGGEEE